MNKTEARDLAADWLIGILQHLEPSLAFEDFSEDEVETIVKEVIRYRNRLINYLKRIRTEEYKRETYR